ncbi:MAG: 1-acyl-sn-glycerol-3-phosphate acyltransferase [Clostridia bacterium]|nr:1-acyl-sn-glycerol-3-phosphate acyltransferase [Clostridia bacterium]
MKKTKKPTGPSKLHYAIARLACRPFSAHVFKRKFYRNELKGVKGPFVVVANHQTALDFVNLIDASDVPLSFVLSHAFFHTLPIRGFLSRMGVIPKQQFQTALSDLYAMKATVKNGGALAIYPAGLMCEDGLPTPLPEATYRFLCWLGVDVYVARTYGAYLVKPKWEKKFRPGRTYMDVYRLFSAEELKEKTEEQVEDAVRAALDFDAYKEQERLRIHYKHGDRIEGLEKVLYRCPHCAAEFTMKVKDKCVLYCESCGYELVSDEFGLLHNEKGLGEEYRYVSDISRLTQDALRARFAEDESLTTVSFSAKIEMIDYKKKKFCPAGSAHVSLARDGFLLDGTLKGKDIHLALPIVNFVSLPFKAGAYFDIQNEQSVYRIYPENGDVVMKLIHMIRIFHEDRVRAATAHPN